jgi:plasmid stabilization system protein ParE
LRVELSPRATRELTRAVTWWLDQVGGRPPLLDELQRLVTTLPAAPRQGALFAKARGHTIYRVLLPSSQYHAYYRVVADTIQIVALWSTSRGRPPRFGRR